MRVSPTATLNVTTCLEFQAIMSFSVQLSQATMMDLPTETSLARSKLLPDVKPGIIVECLNKMNVTARYDWDNLVNQVLLTHDFIYINKDQTT